MIQTKNIDLTFSKKIRFLFSILSNAAQDLLVFCIVLFVLFGAFGFSGFLAFSSDVYEFRTYGHSVLNLFRFLISDIDYDAVAESSVVFGSIFYCLWGMLMLLILSNLFIAILTDAFAAVKSEQQDGESIFSEIKSLKARFSRKPTKLLGKAKTVTNWISRHASMQTAFASADKNDDKELNVEELAEAMQVSTPMAQHLMDEFDIDGNDQLSENEISALLENAKNMARSSLDSNRGRERNKENMSEVYQLLEIISEQMRDFQSEQKNIQQMLTDMMEKQSANSEKSIVLNSPSEQQSDNENGDETVPIKTKNLNFQNKKYNSRLSKRQELIASLLNF